MNAGHDRDISRYLLRVVDKIPSMLAYWDRDLRCRFANRAYERWFGVDPESLIGTSIRDLLGPELFSLNEPHIRAVLRGEEQVFERLIPGPGGVRRHSLANYIPDVVDGVVAGFLVQVTEITRLKDAEAEVRRQAATLRSVAEAIPASVAVVGADDRFRFVNTAFERACGLSRERVIGRTSRDVLGDAEFARRRSYSQRARAGEQVQFDLDYPGPDGVEYLSFTYVPLMLDTGEVDGMVTVSQDITQQKIEELRLTELSRRDPLTELLNRTGFEEFLDRTLRDGGGPTLALLYLDLDYFKSVNDTHGHQAGDQVLKLFARRLVRLVRPSDVVARLGGDEFAIALSGVSSLANAEVVANKVLAVARERFRIGNLLLDVGCSVGMAFGADAATGWHDLIRRADAQLLVAKENRGPSARETR